MTAQEIEAIPRENIRVPRAEFVAVWTAAERFSDEGKRNGQGNWWVTGVVVTCRWLAGAIVPSILGGVEPASAPITTRKTTAHEELIEAECLAAERLAIRNPGGVEGRPGWLEAVVATLNWAWRGSGVPPLDVAQAAAG